jgi:hypothetical protein
MSCRVTIATFTAAHCAYAEWRDEMSWEGGELKHVKFVMLKENTDTQVNWDTQPVEHLASDRPLPGVVFHQAASQPVAMHQYAILQPPPMSTHDDDPFNECTVMCAGFAACCSAHAEQHASILPHL